MVGPDLTNNLFRLRLRLEREQPELERGLPVWTHCSITLHLESILYIYITENKSP